MIKDVKEGINKKDYFKLKNKIEYMERPKIIIQNIVAHVTKPTDHIIIMATFDEEGLLGLGSVGNIFLTDNRYS